MDTLYLETPSAKLDSDREHGRRYCRMYFPLLHAADIRGVFAWVPQQGAARLITRNNVSTFYSLPNAYEERIAAVPGVTRIAAANYFGGMRDVNNPDSEFANFAIEAENFLHAPIWGNQDGPVRFSSLPVI
jgi:hypothetical protein